MFLETPTFPACANFGAQAQPQYSVTITKTASGRERRNRNWIRSLAIFDCTIGPRDEDLIQEILEWWHALGGMECGFRFTDYSDYKSCRTNQDVSRLDQPVQLISVGSYQLIKTYNAGVRQQIRKIYKPTQGTILLAMAGTLKNEGTDYTVDYTTGIITTGFSVTGQLTAGFEFDVPVRFASEFPIQVVEKALQSVSFTLSEIRDPKPDAGEFSP